MLKKLFILVSIILLPSCGSKLKDTIQWKDDPKIIVITNNKILPESGFASSLDLELKGIPINYKYAFFLNDNTCSNNANKHSEGIISEETTINNIPISAGSNNFYTYIETTETDNQGDPYTFCLYSKSYYQATPTLHLTPLEGAMLVSYDLDEEVILSSAKISINDGKQLVVSNNHKIVDLDAAPIKIDLYLIDTLGDSNKKTDTKTPNVINPSNGTLLKKGSNDLLASTGFSSLGTLKVLTVNGDTYGIYSDNTCTTNLISDRLVSASSYDFNVTFSMENNSFFIKRIPNGNTTKSSCSGEYSYTRGDLNLALTPVEAGITATFNATNSVNASFTSSLDLGSSTPVTSPHSFTGLSTTSHTIAITARDDNDIPISKTLDSTPLVLNPSVPVLKKTTSLSFLSNPGFATSAIINITGINTGDTVGIYSNNTCNSTPIVADVEASASNININVPIRDGINNLYVKRKFGESISCSTAVTYTKSNLTLTSTGAEISILNNWSLDYEVTGVTYKIGIGATTPTIPTGTSHTFDNLATNSYNINLEATDLDAFTTTDTSNTTALPLSSPNIKLLRNDLAEFRSNPGFSSSGKLEVSNYNIGDILELYTANTCTGTKLDIITTSSNISYFDLDFTSLVNNFYVKKILSFDNTITSCSAVSTYEKVKFNLWDLYLTSSDDTLTATWSAPDPLITSNSYVLNLMPGNITASTNNLSETFTGLSRNYHTVTITTPPDQDGITASVYGVKLVSPYSPYIAIFPDGKNNRALLNLETDPFKEMKSYTSTNQFAALRADGSIHTWGSPLVGNPVGSEYIYISMNYSDIAALHTDGSISAWGHSSYGGSGAPTGTGFTTISATRGAFAALRNDGSIATWGDSYSGGSDAPSGTDFTDISASNGAFAALHNDGSISVWGDSYSGGSGAPSGTGFTAISAVSRDFAALHEDGSISTWGLSSEVPPTGTDFTAISATGEAFAALHNDGSISVWGASHAGGSGAPSGTDFTAISATGSAFAALHNDGSISVWGSSYSGGSGAPSGTDFTAISATGSAFAALHNDGSIAAWGDSYSGGAPSGTGFTAISASNGAFAALHNDGSISVWGNPSNGGSGAPSGTGFTDVSAITGYEKGTFAALHNDGSISVWGDSYSGGSDAPSGTDFTAISATGSAFAALHNDGSISVWGSSYSGGSGAPNGIGFTAISTSDGAFAALHNDGSIAAWGASYYGGSGAPNGTGFTAISASSGAFAALHNDGSISVWGNSSNGGSGAPSGTGFTAISASNGAFAALHNDGSISVWGNSSNGGSGAPSGTGFTAISASNGAFAALHNDGSISVWGNSSNGGSGAPSGTGFTAISASSRAFAALHSDGSVSIWGVSSGVPPTGTGFTTISATLEAFAALRYDGSVVAWGDVDSNAIPKDTHFVKIIGQKRSNSLIALTRDGKMVPFGKDDYNYLP